MEMCFNFFGHSGSYMFVIINNKNKKKIHELHQSKQAKPRSSLICPRWCRLHSIFPKNWLTKEVGSRIQKRHRNFERTVLLKVERN
mmetsp:Transcript_5466/g.10274  ORF Transcript_5466/g.10274 Transcript_5466/m.10274 type:complete len:86 (-) Transcript_5466:509-766(-)